MSGRDDWYERELNDLLRHNRVTKRWLRVAIAANVVAVALNVWSFLA